MNPHTAGVSRGLKSRVLVFGHMIRFSHSVFALPFALAGVLFAIHVEGTLPPGDTWVWVVVAMVAARSAAMAFNRIADARMDALNPRTRDRAIPSGALTLTAAWIFTLIAVAVFVTAAAMLNPLAFALSPVALALVFFYSLTKRFTWTTHLFLGLALAVAPVGGWVAVTGRLDWAPFLLAAGVLAWVAGFDIFYALQDLEFDRAHKVHSVPARFGVKGAFLAARLLHGICVVSLFLVAWVLNLSPWYFAGMAVMGGLVVYEHLLVSPGDLTRLNKAFFDMNAGISVFYLVTASAGVFL